jgi:ATP-dependent DNA ligase
MREKIKLPLLYKRSVSNKISTWQVIVEDNTFYTTSGFTDGLKVTSAPTICQGKNIGKKNETSPEQQALAEAEAMHRKRIELGAFEDIDRIDEPVYFKPMLAKDYNEYKHKINFNEVYSQPKLDGVRCIIKADGMWSRNGKPLISAPHIFDSIKSLFLLAPDLVLDGELYADKATVDFNTIISCVRKSKPTLEDLEISKKYIEYHIYDLPSSDRIFSERMGILTHMFKKYVELNTYCDLVYTVRVIDHNNIESQYKKYIEELYEGQMIRLNTVYENKRSANLLKHKSFMDDEFEILGYEEGKGNLQNKIGKFKFKTPNGVDFDAAINGTHDYLGELWKMRENLIGVMATVKYFEMTEDGSLRFPKVINISRWDYE